jgi:hypothetical protein
VSGDRRTSLLSVNETDDFGDQVMTIEKVKLIVVRRSAPDVEVQLGIYPTKDVALPEFREFIAKDDTLRATIEPVAGERTADNFISYERSSKAEDG